MPFVPAAIGAVATVGGALMSADSARSAANKQSDAAKAAAAATDARLKPWTDAGTTALGQLTAGTQPGGQYAQKFTMADALNSPAEKEALRAGKEAIDNSAAARGGLLGANDMQANTKFAESTAAQFENQAFNQYISQQQQLLQPVEALAQVATGPAGQVASTDSNALLAAGGAQAGAQVAGGNAATNALGQIGKILGQNSGAIGSMFSSPQSSGGSAGGTVDSTQANIDAYTGNYSYGPSVGGDSDERLKSNKKRVGYTDSGVPIYTYTMGGGKVQMGVMAQDVEIDRPEIVTRNPMSGYKMVDYGRVK